MQVKPGIRKLLLGLAGVFLLAFVLILILGYYYGWEWTGLSPYMSPPKSGDRDFQRGKTLWDWMNLLVVPIALAALGVWFNRREREADQDIAEDQRQATVLDTYFDRMSELLLQEKLAQSDPDSEVRRVARARTLTAFRRLDPERKGQLLRFLHESELISKQNSIVVLNEADLSGAVLTRADLRWADLSGAVLTRADLNGARLSDADLSDADLSDADLSDADLSDADLSDADLRKTNLRGANLSRADLNGARLIGANLSWAKLDWAKLNGANLSWAKLDWAKLHWAKLSRADLRWADLRWADLSRANLIEARLIGANLSRAKLGDALLSGAYLSGANLRGADLSGAKGNIDGQLAQADSLKGATMPDGRSYEEWTATRSS